MSRLNSSIVAPLSMTGRYPLKFRPFLTDFFLGGGGRKMTCIVDAPPNKQTITEIIHQNLLKQIFHPTLTEK